MNPADVFRNVFNNMISSMHTCMPATIISFDAEECKASIQPSLNRAYLSGELPYPVIENVPVMFPRAGDFFLTYPLANGDPCLVIFSERSLDLWKSVGGQLTPDDPRKFDISDAIIIPGLYSFNQKLEGVSGNDVVFSFKGSKVTIKQDGNISIETSNKIAIGTQTNELLDIISQLMVLLQGATVMGTAFGGPLNPTFIAQVNALQLKIDAIKGTI